VELSEHNHRQLFIPRGFAHGFSVLEGDAIVEYKCDNYYAPEAEGAIRWDDPTLAIDWHTIHNEAIVSAKDKLNPMFEECNTLFDYNTDYYA
jgi:dTDP-4-dehydrorhamnose 3,5-epimerase